MLKTKNLNVKTKHFFFLLLFTINISTYSYADHVIGGDILYECLGEGNNENTRRYKIVFTHYVLCTDDVPIFTNETLLLWTTTATSTTSENLVLSLDTISDMANIELSCHIEREFCAKKAIYSKEITLPVIDSSYFLVFERCCRPENIVNIIDNGERGSTFLQEITALGQLTCNSSPVFDFDPLTSFCVGEEIEFSQSAQDIDGNQLIYTFCNPLDVIFGVANRPPPPPPIIPYLLPLYNVNEPLGENGLFINPFDGALTGTPNIIGTFVVGVCVEEYLNGELIGRVRRDILVTIDACTPIIQPSIISDSTNIEGVEIINLCNDNNLYIENSTIDSTNIFDAYWTISKNNTVLLQNDSSWNLAYLLDSIGHYDGQMVISKNSFCIDTLNFQVNVINNLSAEFEMINDSCKHSPVELKNRSILPESYDTNFKWLVDDSAIADSENTHFLFTRPGQFNVSYIIEADGFCRDTSNQLLNYQPAPNIIILSPSEKAGCAPLTTEFNNLSSPVDSQYLVEWDFGDNNSGLGISPSHIYSDSGSYDIYISITSPLGCAIDTIFPKLITVSSPPIANFTWNIISESEQSAFLQLNNLSSFDRYWEWSSNNNLFSNERETQIELDLYTSFDICLNSYNQHSCVDTICNEINVIPNTTLFFPNAFTPNNDGLNDIFMAVGRLENLVNFKINVFDRWGQLVFSSNDPFQSWDGSNQGKLLPNGVYHYEGTAISIDQSITNFSGSVALVK